MAEDMIPRRSGRNRKAVKTLIDEQNEEAAAPPPKRQRKKAKAATSTRPESMSDDSVLSSEPMMSPYVLEASNVEDPVAPKTKHRKKKKSAHPASDAVIELSSDEEFEAPKKKRAKNSKQPKLPGKVDEHGVCRLDTVELRPPGEKRPPQVWDVPKRTVDSQSAKAPPLAAMMAETFQDRYQRQVSKIPRLAPGQKERRLKSLVKCETDSYSVFLDRARTQRLVVLGRSHDNEEACHANHDDCPYHEVKIAGTTGNVYTVIISHLPSCSCPNTSFKGRNSGQGLCKHILYVLHYVLKAPAYLCYQNAFLTSELREITANAPALPTEVVSAEDLDRTRKPIEDDCPICCMDFEEGDDITWCRAACGNNIHKGCFDQWAKTKRGGVVTCPFCRTEWEVESKKAGRSASMMDVKMPTIRANGYYNVEDQIRDP